MPGEESGSGSQAPFPPQKVGQKLQNIADDYLPSVVLVILVLYILYFLFAVSLNFLPFPSFYPEIGSVVATFLLILIYHGMKKDQRRMKELQEDQIIIEKEKNSPSLFVLDYGYKKPDDYQESDPGKDYHPYFTIKNLGESPARYLQIEVEPELMIWTGHDSGLEKFDESGLEMIQRPLIKSEESSDNSPEETPGVSLEPGEDEDFWIPCDFPVKDNDTGYFALPDKVEGPNPLRPYEMTTAAAHIEANDWPGIPPNNAYFDDDDVDIRNDEEDENQSLGKYLPDSEDIGPEDIPFDRLKLTISFRHLLTKDFSELHGEPQHSNFTLILPLKAIDSDKLEQNCSNDLDLPMREWESETMWNSAMEMEQYESRKYEALSAKRSNTAYDLSVDLIENYLRKEPDFPSD